MQRNDYLPGNIHRVLMTADTVGGVWNYALTVCRGLCESGVQVVLATMGRRCDREQIEAFRRLGDDARLVESAYKLEWMDDPWDDVRKSAEWLREISAQTNPDVVHLNSYALARESWDCPVVVVGHSCVLSWWENVKRQAAPKTFDAYAEAVGEGLSNADLIICPSRAMLDTLRRHYRPATPGIVIPNGYTPARDYDPAVVKKPQVLTVGRLWDEAKNVGALASVAGQIRWSIVAAGDTTPPRGEGFPMPPGLQCIGRRTPQQLEAAYAEAAIYAAPVRYEPFGLSILEASRAGCALVLGDIDSLREIWGDAAEYVRPDDLDQLAWVLQRLIDDTPRREQLARKASRRGRLFSAERTVAGYRGAYEQVRLRRGQRMVNELVRT